MDIVELVLAAAKPFLPDAVCELERCVDVHFLRLEYSHNGRRYSNCLSIPAKQFGELEQSPTFAAHTATRLVVGLVSSIAYVSADNHLKDKP